MRIFFLFFVRNKRLLSVIIIFFTKFNVFVNDELFNYCELLLLFIWNNIHFCFLRYYKLKCYNLLLLYNNIYLLIVFFFYGIIAVYDIKH